MGRTVLWGPLQPLQMDEIAAVPEIGQNQTPRRGGKKSARTQILMDGAAGLVGGPVKPNAKMRMRKFKSAKREKLKREVIDNLIIEEDNQTKFPSKKIFLKIIKMITKQNSVQEDSKNKNSVQDDNQKQNFARGIRKHSRDG
jgi:hypothetical protein